MTGEISIERVFSLSCFEGLKLVRKYSAKYPLSGDHKLINLIESVEADGASLDLAASVYLGKFVRADCSTDGQTFYQVCIKAVILERQPIWAGLMGRGRRRFIDSLGQDDRAVFRQAGLLENPPSEHVVTWWDDVSGHARVIHKQLKMGQARQAELLTIRHEKARLLSIGIDKDPEWPGLDDNFAGYDVLSYDQGHSGIVNRLIEVKSTTASPLRFYVSRHEWDQALKASHSYHFHVWDMNQTSPVLHERTVEDVKPHVPADCGSGKWSEAVIPIVV